MIMSVASVGRLELTIQDLALNSLFTAEGVATLSGIAPCRDLKRALTCL